jgi:predicted aspartyl protease
MKQLLWIAMIAATSAATQTNTVPPTQPAGELDEITVTAPEPRYVAPTTRDRSGRIWAPVYLDGKGPFRLVLDTGANHSAVIERVAAVLGDHARSRSTVRLHGATGTAIVPIIRVDELVVGDLMQAPVKLPIVLDVFGGADGVLGNDGLHDKRIVIDFKHDFISIRRSRRERAGDGFRTVPITFAKDYLPIIDARVGGVPVKAIIDTGAPDSLGNMALLGALKQRVGDTADTEIEGVTLDIEHGYRARMPRIYLQTIEVRGASLNFGDVYIFQHWRMTSEPSIMLGMDVLGVMDQIIIDYRTHELYIRAGHTRSGT